MKKKNKSETLTLLAIGALSATIITGCSKSTTVNQADIPTSAPISLEQAIPTDELPDDYVESDASEDGYFGEVELDDGNYPVFLYNGLTYVVKNDHAETIFTLYSDDTFEEYIVKDSISYEGTNYPVTIIGENTFTYCSNVQNIVLPPTLIEIQVSAFDSCSSLTCINLSEGLKIIGDSAFASCESLKSITLPSTLTEIGSNAFYDCLSLEAIEIPAGVAVIPASCFSNCERLASIFLQEGLTTISDEAFWACESLKSIDIPNTVTAIGNRVFYDCMLLTSLQLPDSITYVGDDSFDYCDELTELFVPANMLDKYTEQFYGYEFEVKAK